MQFDVEALDGAMKLCIQSTSEVSGLVLPHSHHKKTKNKIAAYQSVKDFFFFVHTKISFG